MIRNAKIRKNAYIKFRKEKKYVFSCLSVKKNLFLHELCAIHFVKTFHTQKERDCFPNKGLFSKRSTEKTKNRINLISILIFKINFYVVM